MADLLFCYMKEWRKILISTCIFGIAFLICKYQWPVDFSLVQSVIAGMLAGILLICLMLTQEYVKSDKLQNTRDFQEKFGMPVLGVFQQKKEKKGLSACIDNWVLRTAGGKYVEIPPEEQAKIVALHVKTAIEKHSEEKKWKRVLITGTQEEIDLTVLYGQLTEKIGEIVFSSYRHFTLQPSMGEELEEYDGVLFIEKRGISFLEHIKEERKQMEERKIDILGVVVF
ncbi:MAG: hypothetical protein HFH24_03265 [Ruminococcus sp.]|nr:hypothetical protein [Ruminococcus sp.]